MKHIYIVFFILFINNIQAQTVNLKLIGEWQHPLLRRFDVNHSYAIVGIGWNDSLALVDITNPNFPIEKTRFKLLPDAPDLLSPVINHIESAGNTVFIGAGRDLFILEIK